jgi:NAD(P)-dependent dehydrogenase (short-subunit alcohol dehydrogenase family)
MDLLDPASLVAAPARVIEEWGRIDVLFNNAIFQGSGTMDRILDLTPEAMTRIITGNYVNQVLLTQQVIPHMLEQGSGRIINMVSGSARLDPVAPAGAGGWGIAYSASKAAFGRVAGGINAEFGDKISAFNVDPGNVVTEKRKARNPTDSFSDYGSESPDATGATVVWLATAPDADRMRGKWIYAPKLVEELGLSI